MSETVTKSDIKKQFDLDIENYKKVSAKDEKYSVIVEVYGELMENYNEILGIETDREYFEQFEKLLVFGDDQFINTSIPQNMMVLYSHYIMKFFEIMMPKGKPDENQIKSFFATDMKKIPIKEGKLALFSYIMANILNLNMQIENKLELSAYLNRYFEQSVVDNTRLTKVNKKDVYVNLQEIESNPQLKKQFIRQALYPLTLEVKEELYILLEMFRLNLYALLYNREDIGDE